ncbi:MAG: TlyA family RNA methyltransferase [Gaiellaceae bacterium]
MSAAAPVSRSRIDEAVVARGLAENRSRARALILAGDITVNGEVVHRAGAIVRSTDELGRAEKPRFASRGGEKLAHALDQFGIDVSAAIAADFGASTGGFTDCLLQAGARRVVALDVGHGQLHPKLRADPRVTVLERVNVRSLRCDELPFSPSFLTCDVSFIGLAKALPPALACAAPRWRAVVLVKPQFEAGPADVGKGGVVRDPQVRRRVLDGVAERVPEWGGHVLGVAESPLRGPKGNREFLLSLAAAE